MFTATIPRISGNNYYVHMLTIPHRNVAFKINGALHQLTVVVVEGQSLAKVPLGTAILLLSARMID